MDKISIVSKKDYNKVREIWEKVFTNDNSYLDYIFNGIMPKGIILAYKQDNDFVSCLTIIPINFIDNTSAQPSPIKGIYLYGVATVQEQRAKGISSKLLDYAINYCKNLNYKFIIGVPKNDSLFDYFYKLRGFLRLGECKQITKLDKTIQTDATNIYSYLNSFKHPRIFLFSKDIIEQNIVMGEIDNYISDNPPEICKIEPMILPLNGSTMSTFKDSEFIFPMG